MTQRSRSGLNPSGNELTRNLSGNFRPQSSRPAEPLLIDPTIKSGISVRKLNLHLNTLPPKNKNNNKKQQRRQGMLTFSQNPRKRGGGGGAATTSIKVNKTPCLSVCLSVDYTLKSNSFRSCLPLSPSSLPSISLPPPLPPQRPPLSSHLEPSPC